MKLTGKQIKILREGILGAYPEEELIRFLHEEMDIVFSDIAEGKTHSSVSVQRGMSQAATDIDSKGSDCGGRDREEVPRRAARIASVINSKTFRF